jgi:ParB-like chromosome segregation protein Spo0J
VTTDEIIKAIRDLAGAPTEDRVQVFNAISKAIGEMVRDIAPDPAVSPQLIPAELVQANDYNPNRVASTEMELLENSILADGITMCVVVMPDGAGGGIVVDGFHRRTVAAERLKRTHIPCAVIDRPLADRMASTVRHNRARGKHQVDLMASLVKAMMGLGWGDEQIAENLGMSTEELLRLRQMVGAARLFAADEYSREWAPIGGEDE